MPELIGVLAGAYIFILGILPFGLFALAVPYAVLRLRNEGPDDPQLGTKAGLQYFFSVSVLIVLTGMTIMSVDLITREKAPQGQKQPPMGRSLFVPTNNDDLFNPVQRTGLALVMSGMLFALVHFLLALLLTNRHNWSRVRRTFAGWRFTIHGLVVMACVISLAVIVVQEKAFEDDSYRAMKVFFAVLVIWFPAWLVQLGLLKLYSMASRPTERNRVELVDTE